MGLDVLGIGSAAQGLGDILNSPALCSLDKKCRDARELQSKGNYELQLAQAEALKNLNKNQDAGLSTGAIVGIIAGVIVIIALVVLIIIKTKKK